MKKIFAVLAAFVILTGFLIWFFLVKEKTLEVETSIVKKEDVTAQISASGKIDSEEIVELSFEIAGKVAWIGSNVGDSVKAGQVIAALNRRDLEISLSQKEAAQRAAQSDLEKVLDDIRLFQLSNPQITETQTQKNLRERAESARDQATEAVRAAKAAIDKTVITSPIDGVLISKNAQVSQNIQAFVPAFKVGNLGQLIFVAEIDQTDIGVVRIGQKTRVRLDTFPARELEGEVVTISPETSTTKTGATVVKTEIKLPALNFPVQLGLTGDTQILTQEKEGVVTLTSGAIFEEEGKTYVFLLKDKKVSKRQIKTGLSPDEKVEITEGVTENEVAITSDLDKLKDGQKVRIKK